MIRKDSVGIVLMRCLGLKECCSTRRPKIKNLLQKNKSLLSLKKYATTQAQRARKRRMHPNKKRKKIKERDLLPKKASPYQKAAIYSAIMRKKSIHRRNSMSSWKSTSRNFPIIRKRIKIGIG